MEALDDERIIRSCEYLFEKFFQKDIRGRVKEVKTSKWRSDPFAYGTYSFHSDDDDLSVALAEPLFDNSKAPKVLFAGEATHEHFFSTVHGAIESGFREAKRLINFYSQSTPKTNENRC